jgi:hypothetical protein
MDGARKHSETSSVQAPSDRRHSTSSIPRTVGITVERKLMQTGFPATTRRQKFDRGGLQLHRVFPRGVAANNCAELEADYLPGYQVGVVSAEGFGAAHDGYAAS